MKYIAKMIIEVEAESKVEAVKKLLEYVNIISPEISAADIEELEFDILEGDKVKFKFNYQN